MDLSYVCHAFQSRMSERQDLACDRAGRNPSNRLSGRGPAAALPIANTVLRLVGEVGVRRTKGGGNLLISFWLRVFVAHDDGNRRAQRLTFENAGENFAAIDFVAL